MSWCFFMKRENLSIILVEPQGPLNIGAVCRAMMNFGFSDLRLVNPCKRYQSAEARKMALSAQHLLTQAKVYDTLASALSDCNIAFGTTRRYGRYRKNFLTPDACGEKIAALEHNVRCAIVLGREDNGLDTEELAMCQHFVTVPTDDGFPSMNLSHASCLFLYETAKAMRNKVSTPVSKRPPASMDATEQMYAHMKETLLEIEFLDPQNPEHLLRTFRRIFGRAGLMDRDVRIIRGLMSRIKWLDNQRSGENKCLKK